jgi:hypothetical protein
MQLRQTGRNVFINNIRRIRPASISTPARRKLISTVTVVPPGLNVRCTVGFPEPSRVTVIVAVPPAGSEPDIGATTTFFSMPAGSETVQSTGPPDAVSVIVPESGGWTTRVAGLTASVPAVVALALAVADADAGDEAGADDRAATALGLGPGVRPPDGPLPLPLALAVATTLAGGATASPEAPGARVAAGSVPAATGLVLLAVAEGPAPATAGPPGWWCGGTTAMVTPAAMAAAVPAAVL